MNRGLDKLALLAALFVNPSTCTAIAWHPATRPPRIASSVAPRLLAAPVLAERAIEPTLVASHGVNALPQPSQSNGTRPLLVASFRVSCFPLLLFAGAGAGAALGAMLMGPVLQEQVADLVVSFASIIVADLRVLWSVMARIPIAGVDTLTRTSDAFVAGCAALTVALATAQTAVLSLLITVGATSAKLMQATVSAGQLAATTALCGKVAGTTAVANGGAKAAATASAAAASAAGAKAAATASVAAAALSATAAASTSSAANALLHGLTWWLGSAYGQAESKVVAAAIAISAACQSIAALPLGAIKLASAAAVPAATTTGTAGMTAAMLTAGARLCRLSLLVLGLGALVTLLASTAAWLGDQLAIVWVHWRYDLSHVGGAIKHMTNRVVDWAQEARPVARNGHPPPADGDSNPKPEVGIPTPAQAPPPRGPLPRLNRVPPPPQQQVAQAQSPPTYALLSRPTAYGQALHSPQPRAWMPKKRRLYSELVAIASSAPGQPTAKAEEVQIMLEQWALAKQHRQARRLALEA